MAVVRVVVILCLLLGLRLTISKTPPLTFSHNSPNVIVEKSHCVNFPEEKRKKYRHGNSNIIR